MKKIEILIFLCVSILCTMCTPPTPPKGMKTNTTAPVADTTNLKKEEGYVSNNETYALQFEKTTNISKEQSFSYYDDNGADKSNGNIFRFVFESENNLKVILEENGFKWTSTWAYQDKWAGEPTITGTTYTNTVSDGANILTISIFLDNTSELQQIKLGARQFYKRAKKPVTNTKQVIVGEKDNLTKIIKEYNAAYGTSFTISDIVRMNPKLKTRTNYSLIKGEPILFQWITQ